MSNKSKKVNSNSIKNANVHSLIVKTMKIEEKPKPTKFKSSSSENNLKLGRGIKEKIVSRVKSWSNRDKYTVNSKFDIEADLAKANDAHNHSENEIIDEVLSSNLTRARGSLENLLRDEQKMPKDDLSSRSCFSAAETNERSISESPKSSPLLQGKSKPNSTFSFWDPFDKKGRKSRREINRNKKRTKNNDISNKETTSEIPAEGNSCLLKQGNKENDVRENDSENETLEAETSYKYKYFPKNSKSVVFTNEVFVVYFNGTDVVCESKEPLKKDTDQQERNKEMRQGHLMKAQEKYHLCLY